MQQLAVMSAKTSVRASAHTLWSAQPGMRSRDRVRNVFVKSAPVACKPGENAFRMGLQRSKPHVCVHR